MQRFLTRALMVWLAAIAGFSGQPDLSGKAMAQTPPVSWPEEKCAIYREAWTRFLAARGPSGLGRDFLAAQEAFIASGCTERRVCPRSKEELDAANTLTILAMNARMASTFLPFSCKP